MSSERIIPAAEARVAITVVNSRFIATAAPVFSVEAARAFVSRVRAEFADASHNVPAYVIGHGATTIAHCHDDGEPAGTAGRPVLAVLQGSGLGDVAVVVTRYFGGAKLGTGGLVRAYAGTAKLALDNATFSEFIEQAEYELTLNYKQIDRFKRDLAQLGGELIHAEFADVVHAWVRVPISAWDALRDKYAV